MSKTPTYSLGAVLRETNIKPDTLRAWERRYSLPQPMRSEGGHRLYAQRDIEIIKWLLEKQEEGMRIGQATKLWKRKIEQGEDPLLDTTEEILFLATADFSSQVERFRQTWINACLNFDEDKAEQAANEIFSRFAPEKAFLEIFIPALQQIGELWYQDKASVQQEHFASALLVQRLYTFIGASPPPTRFEKIIVGCPPGEEHDIPLLFLILFLRRRGFKVIDLGRDVPLEKFRETAILVAPEIIILAAQQLSTAARVEEIAREFIGTKIPVAYSGRVFQSTPATRNHIHAYFLGTEMSGTFSAIENIFKEDAQNAFALSKNKYENLFANFSLHQAAVQAALTERLAAENFPIGELTEPTTYLNENVAAALYLGNLDLLTPELEWVKTLLRHRQIKEVHLSNYLQHYIETVDEIIGDDAAPLIAWFEKQALRFRQEQK